MLVKNQIKLHACTFMLTGHNDIIVVGIMIILLTSYYSRGLNKFHFFKKVINVKKHPGDMGGACSPKRILKSRVSENILGVILQNSEDYKMSYKI